MDASTPNRRSGSTLGIGERRSVNAALGALAWLVALLFFFPIFWLVISRNSTRSAAQR
jgi:hypothetical protein